MNIDTDTILQFHPQVAARALDGHEIVVLSDAGEVLVLNPTGTLVWQGVAEGRSVGAIAGELAATYGIELACALADVRALLEQLEALHAINDPGSP